ncbi:MAG: sulfite exporter TauE/SafE family protein [Clostridia bacterium]|nr:sulfite exporter TauE/SafE family protein [Clostridia bacterium]
MGIDQHTAQGANLIFFVPTSISSIFVTVKEKLINWKIGVPVAIFGVIGSITGAKLSVNLDVKVLKKCFGIFLILIAIYEIYTLFKIKKKEKLKGE